MKKMLAFVLSSAALLVLTGSAHALKFDMSFDAGPYGLKIAFTRGPLSQTIQLTGTEDPPQTLRIMPGLSADISLTSLGPDGKQQLTLHYVIANEYIRGEDQEGYITLPYEHGYITNRLFYVHGNPNIIYDVQGSTNVALWRSRYSLQFGLTDLKGLFETQAAPGTNDIHQTINRDNGVLFADINLTFHPRLFYNKVVFNITMTPQGNTGKWPYPDPTTFTGTLPMPYGSYHFWFYRDSKN